MMFVENVVHVYDLYVWFIVRKRPNGLKFKLLTSKRSFVSFIAIVDAFQSEKIMPLTSLLAHFFRIHVSILILQGVKRQIPVKTDRIIVFTLIRIAAEFVGF